MLSNILDRRIVAALVALCAAVLAPATEGKANGIIISPVRIVPEPRPPRRRRPIHSWMPFRVKSQQVDIEISDAQALTTIEQVFINHSRRQAEGTYLFPISERAGVHKFAMWMNGREVFGEMLDADRARQIYESIVSKMHDPGLLQFAGRGLIQAKVFPIPAEGECRIKLQYSEPVRFDSGLAAYRLPLGSGGCRFDPIERFSIKALVRSAKPLTSVFSPSHECGIDRRSEREVVVSLEKRRRRPEDDFQLYWKVGEERFGLSLLTHRVPGEEGFFMARITPRISGENDAVQPKNICFVLDTSGSMAESNKIAQAKKALKFCVTNLDKEDRFNVVTFATETRQFRDGWSKANEEVKSAARAFIDNLKAVGGTDIDAALRKALLLSPNDKPGTSGSIEEAWRKNPYFVVFITDGEPTVGVTDPDAILKNVATANPGSVLGSPHRRILKPSNSVKQSRIFVLGVGYQVNTKLLDRLADDNGGARNYVTPEEDLELKISAFYTKLANPVLSNLQLSYQGVSVHDVYPKQLPELFKGSELVVVGRYGSVGALAPAEPRGGRIVVGSRTQKIALSGISRGEARGFTFACNFPSEERRQDFLPRVWAMRKIGYLLDELRLHGENQELKNEVIRLAKKYGILTPYTSFLVQQDDQLARRDRRAPVGSRPISRSINTVFGNQQNRLNEASTAQRAGKGKIAVGASVDNRGLRKVTPMKTKKFLGSIVADLEVGNDMQLINFIGARTFYFEDGRWVDADYDGAAETTKLVAYSKDYYDFLKANHDAGQYFAQGDRVVLNWQGQIYEIIPAEKEAAAP